MPLDPSMRRQFEGAFRTDFGGVRLHLDSPVATSMDAHAATIGEDVHLAGGSYRPETDAGRHLLTHELAHVVQQRGARTSAAPTNRGDATEREAEHAVADIVDGRAPSLSSSPRQYARNEPQDVQPRRRPAGHDGNAAATAMVVTLSGIFFTAEGAVFRPGPRRVQAMAIALRRLVGNRYRPGLERDVLAELDRQRNLRTFGTLGRQAGEARRDEPVGQISLDPAGARAVIGILEDHHGVRVSLTEAQRALLALGITAQDAYRQLTASDSLEIIGELLPSWYSKPVFDRQMTQRSTLLNAHREKNQTYTRQPNDENRAALVVVLREILASLRPAATAWTAIREDRGIRGDRRLRGLVRQLDADAGLLGTFLMFADTQPSLLRVAPADAAARTELLTRFQRFAARATEPGVSDDELRERPTRANAPPNPATLQRYPDAPPPLFEAALGAVYTFTMAVNYPDTLEALGRGIGNTAYTWERIKISDAAFERWRREEEAERRRQRLPVARASQADRPQTVRETAEDVVRVSEAAEHVGNLAERQDATSTAPSRGEVAATRFGHAWEYAETDAERAIEYLADDLGPRGVAAATLVGANNILRFAGTSVRVLFEAAAHDRSESQVTFPQPGVYIVRCRAIPIIEGDAEFIRAPSVAYLPVYARDPNTLSERGARLAMQGRAAAETERNRLLAIRDRTQTQQGQLNELNRALGPLTGLLTSNRDALRDQIHIREEELQRLREPRDYLRIRTLRAELSSYRDELTRTEQILEHRNRRSELTAPGVRPERLTATFLSDEGQSVTLALEVVHRQTRAGRVTYFVSDSTTPRSGAAPGTGTTRPDAILNGLQEVLEGVGGYGRGRVSVGIDGQVYTRRIDQSLGGIAVEAVESLTTIASAVLIAAAPFTGGATLALLLPVGLIGAVPSAYRLAQRSEMGTFEWDLETAMDIVNIAGVAAQVLRPVTTGIRFLRIGQAVAIVGIGTDALGVLVVPVSVMSQLSQLEGLPDGVRRARAMEIIGMAMVQSGIVIGGHLVADAGRTSVGPTDLSLRGAGEPTVSGAEAEAHGAPPTTHPGSAAPESGSGQHRESAEPGRAEGPPTTPVPPQTRTGRATSLTFRELRIRFFRALRRVPMAHDADFELQVDPRTFETAYRNAGGTDRELPAGFVDPVSGRIWILVGYGERLTLFHEIIHQYSIGSGARNRFLRRLGFFFEEACTEWIARRQYGSPAAAHAYDAHVTFVDRLIEFGVQPETIERAYLDGDIASLRAELQASFNGDPVLTDRFLNAVRDIDRAGGNDRAKRDAEHMLETRQEPVTPAAEHPTEPAPFEDDEPTQPGRPVFEEPSGAEASSHEEPTQPIPVHERQTRPGLPWSGRRPSTEEPPQTANDVLNEARRQAAAGQRRRAVQSFERARQHPDASDDVRTAAILAIGEQNMLLGRFNTAVLYFESFLQRPGVDVELGMRRLNEARRQAGLPESVLRGPATAEGAGVVATSPAQIEQLQGVARDHFERGDFGAAIAAFERLRQMPGVPDEVRARCVHAIGMCNLRAGRHATALFYFERYLADPHANVALGEAGIARARRGLGLEPRQSAPRSTEPPTTGRGPGNRDDDITPRNVLLPTEDTPPSGTRLSGHPVVTRSGGESFRGTWPGDDRAIVIIDPARDYLRVLDVYRGSQLASGGDMLVDVILMAQRQGLPEFDRIRLSNLQPEPSLAAYRAGLPAADDPVFRGMIETLQRRLGRTAREIVYAEDLGKVYIDLYFAPVSTQR